MHRTKSRFASRITRVATALERRGIVATYEVHDRLLSNRRSRRRFAASPPALDAVQERVLEQLRGEGYAVLPFAELFPDPETWATVGAQGDAFAAQTEAALAGEGAAELRVRAGKEFVVRLHSYGVELGFDDAWFTVSASRRMLDLANAYLGLWSKLEYVDLWYSIPQPGDAERRASQRWHRDYNDTHLLKSFLYLVDVDESTGPFQYVAGTARDGPYAGMSPWRPLGETYPAGDRLPDGVPDDAVQTFTGPRGTLVLCNTSGYHRGGFATGRPRVLATATYASPAALASLSERNYSLRGADAVSLDAETRFALTD